MLSLRNVYNHDEGLRVNQLIDCLLRLYLELARYWIFFVRLRDEKSKYLQIQHLICQHIHHLHNLPVLF